MSTYASELQTENTRVRALCTEVINELLPLSLTLTDADKKRFAAQLNRLFAASRGEQFTLNDDPKEPA